MPKIAYEAKNFRAAALEIIDQANDIIGQYQAMGFDLTLRQLYYQFVSRDIIPNTERSYKRLGSIINDARMAGKIDWNAIVDRTRNLRGNNHWTSPAEIVRACANQFRYDLWADQLYRPEVWIEKDALIGVIQRVCQENDVDYFACRGYNSQSEQWRAGVRFARYAENEQIPIIFHLGDHDPSGMDMTHDNDRRLSLFSYDATEVRRLALNMDQIDQYNPPPNPTKLTDSRATEYISLYGGSCWELDALEPQVIEELIQDAIFSVRDHQKWDDAVERQAEAREKISSIADDMEQ